MKSPTLQYSTAFKGKSITGTDYIVYLTRMQNFTRIASRPLSIVFMLTAAMLMTQCSKNDPTPIVCYMTTLTEVSGGDVFLQTMTYNPDNTVATVTHTGGGTVTTITFNYDSDKRANSAMYAGGALSATETYTYDEGNNLTKSVFAIGGSSSTSEYFYNSSGQMIEAVFTGSNYMETDTYIYPNTTTQNYSSVEYTYVSGAFTSSGTNAYEYDNKRNPRHLIPGIPVISDNNQTKRTSIVSGTTSVTTYEYTYNDHGYPTNATITSMGSTINQTMLYICK